MKTIIQKCLALVMTGLLVQLVLGISMAQESDVSLKLNGKKVDTEVIVLNGVTYVPVRTISELLGLKVGWESDTNTVTLDESLITVETQSDDISNGKASYIPLSDFRIWNEESYPIAENKWIDGSEFEVDGIQYKNGYGFDFDEAEYQILFFDNKDLVFENFSAIFALDSNLINDLEYTDILITISDAEHQDEPIYSQIVSKDDNYHSCNVDIKGIKELSIEFYTGSYGKRGNYLLFLNPMMK